MEKEEEKVVSNNAKEEKMEEDEETQWTKVKIERKKEKKNIRQLEEQTRVRPDPIIKPVPTTPPIPEKYKHLEPWQRHCFRCRNYKKMPGCVKCATFEWD